MLTTYQHPELLVSTEWLADNLNKPGLQIYDCTTYLKSPDLNTPYQVVSGHDDFLAAHVPGAAFLDLQAQLSDNDSAYRFTMPTPAQFAASMSSAGVSDNSSLILYSRGSMQWATRIWWMLRSIGFDRAAILDGGWEKWQQESRPVASGEHHYSPGKLSVQARDGLFADRDQVLTAIDGNSTTVINALSAELHKGHSARYGRPGRIPGSVNVPAGELRDPSTLTLVTAPTASRHFVQAGVSSDKPVIIYCGGGIAATLDAFVLHQLGHQTIAVYDHSLNEWSNQADLPVESD
ncbi:MAG: sulfurtransferase [Burkholderiaceae bacterium]